MFNLLSKSLGFVNCLVFIIFSNAKAFSQPAIVDTECATALMSDYMGEMPQLAELNCAMAVINQLSNWQSLFSWDNFSDPTDAITSTVLSCGSSLGPGEAGMQRVIGFLGEASNRNSTNFADHPCFTRMWNTIDSALASAPSNTNSGIHSDPYIKTLDNYYYKFQAEGAFLACKSMNDQLEIQTLFKGYKEVGSLTTAVAIRLNKDIITFSVTKPNVYINGIAYEGTFPALISDGTKIIEAQNISHKRQFMLVSKEGDYFPIKITAMLIDFRLRLTEKYKGNMQYGLLGNFDGDRNNDFTTSEGEVLSLYGLKKEEKCDVLYKKFGTNCRIDIKKSLFPEKIKNENQNINLNIPLSCNTSAIFTPAKIEEAKAKCIVAGINDPVTMQNAIFDYVATESDDVIESHLENYYLSNNQLIGEYEVYFSYPNAKNETIENTVKVALGMNKSAIDGGNDIISHRVVTDYIAKKINRFYFKKGVADSDLVYDIEMRSNGFATFKSSKANEVKTIDGIVCTKYMYSDNKKRTGEMWVAEGLKSNAILPFNNMISTLKGIAFMKFPRFAAYHKEGLVMQAFINDPEGIIQYKVNKLIIGLPDSALFRDPKL